MFVSQLKHVISRKPYSKQLHLARYVSTLHFVNEESKQSQSNNFRLFKAQDRLQSTKNILWDKEYRKVMDNLNTTYPEFKKNMLKKIPTVWAQKRFSKVLDYNVFQENRSHMFIFLKLSDDLSGTLNKQNVNMTQIYTMSWILETLTMAGLMIDDVADDSRFRLGKPCWHKLQDNAKIFPNDVYMMTNVAFSLLWEQFGKLPNYDQIIALINKVIAQASTAEMLDYLAKKSLSNSNLDEYYDTLARLKGSFGYELQIKAALYMNGYESIPFNNLLDRICSNLGYYHSILNDYFDIQSNPFEEGKKYENIRQGDLTWFLKEAVKALPDERYNLIMENYGSNKENSVEKVLQLYNEADLLKKFESHEKNIRRTLLEDIDQLPVTTLQTHLQQILFGFEKLIRREKNDVIESFVWILF